MEWRGAVAGTESSFTPLLTTVQLAPLLGTALPDLQLLPFLSTLTPELKSSKPV
jgi:hypothetical protein